MPEATRATARQVVTRVVAEAERRVADRTRSAAMVGLTPVLHDPVEVLFGTQLGGLG